MGVAMTKVKRFWITLVDEYGDEYISPISIEELKKILIEQEELS